MNTLTAPAPSGARTAGNYAPVFVEHETTRLAIKGALPRALNGTLFRNGPNPRFPTEDSHWFVGDGMIHAFTLEDGAATYRNRWVRTPKWLAEDAAGRSLFRGFGQTRPGTPAGIDGGVANTNVLLHGGRLLALEEGHLPMALAPDSLATEGYVDFDGTVAGPFTAHPKICPQTGELLFYGYHLGGGFSPVMSHGSIGPDGRTRRFERFEAPFPSMVHDFAATRNHLVFPILPLTGSLVRARTGRPPYAWEPELGSHIGIMRRDGSAADMAWFRGPACYVFHVMNAWEDGSRILVDVMQLDAPPFPLADGSPAFKGPPPRARLCRWTFDLAGGSDRFHQTFLDDLGGEFPRIDDRLSGSANGHGWFAGAGPAAAPGSFDTIAHFDFTTWRRNSHAFAPGSSVSEPVFVPRAADAAEGDGWVLAVVRQPEAEHSELAVFDALQLDDGPLATVTLPARVPAGLHGNWVPA
ncbi:carotenoid cleavage dioxygenase [Stella humosa]|uniref:Dioxygenase n=1 Tax=Stella humosa TaxID=94 RepID=A0A3N1KY20_9PROT|nr:carotenoid oxygenase family protein [Stella humosa]ROP84332.1 carotenoid cleavage dioxygenase [Stella humosa]BBK33846.1 carotenoid oxygenase [Stella humosa]